MHWFLYRLSQHAGYELVLWTKHPTHIGEHLAVATEVRTHAFGVNRQAPIFRL
jgi:hypothetical protein